MNKHLFLDLEDTIITPVLGGWHNTELINVQKISQIIKTFNPDTINLFSFAIWNKHELSEFNLSTRNMIERALNIKLQITPTVDDDIIPACCKLLNIAVSTVDFSEMSCFWGKHEAFRLFTRFMFKNTWKSWQQETSVMLLDDAVINEHFTWPDLHISGKIVNIDLVPD